MSQDVVASSLNPPSSAGVPRQLTSRSSPFFHLSHVFLLLPPSFPLSFPPVTPLPSAAGLPRLPATSACSWTPSVSALADISVACRNYRVALARTAARAIQRFQGYKGSVSAPHLRISVTSLL